MEADDIYEDEKDLDEETILRWQEDWIITEISKLLSTYEEDVF